MPPIADFIEKVKKIRENEREIVRLESTNALSIRYMLTFYELLDLKLDKYVQIIIAELNESLYANIKGSLASLQHIYNQ
ncbi:25938_t:CDS:1, partial [Gigaspora margarita]